MLSQHTMDIVKSTVPILEKAGTDITDHFYKKMFKQNPELMNIFNMSNQVTGAQQFALFSAVAAYAKHIDDLEALDDIIARVAHKHASLYVQPEHYPIVGANLLATLKELSPEQFTPEVEQAWREAYQFLADLFIHYEENLYQLSEEKVGGWRGARPFIISEKIQESDLVTSFVLRPEDGKAVADYRAGQFLGIKVKPAHHDYEQIRQYSLSDCPNGQTYRISIKREQTPKAGIVSNLFHDVLHVGDRVEAFPPAGAFYLNSVATDHAVVLISAGVGITPMLSMLELLQAATPDKETFFLHACENKTQHSFDARIAKIATNNPHVHTHTWYRQNEEKTTDIRLGLHSGLMVLDDIQEKLPLSNGHFYICGPTPFMASIRHQLMALAVPAGHIFYEVFGPHKDL